MHGATIVYQSPGPAIATAADRSQVGRRPEQVKPSPARRGARARPGQVPLGPRSLQYAATRRGSPDNRPDLPAAARPAYAHGQFTEKRTAHHGRPAMTDIVNLLKHVTYYSCTPPDFYQRLDC